MACSNSRNTGTRNTGTPRNTPEHPEQCEKPETPRNTPKHLLENPEHPGTPSRKPGTPRNTFQKTRNTFQNPYIPQESLEHTPSKALLSPCLGNRLILTNINININRVPE